MQGREAFQQAAALFAYGRYAEALPLASRAAEAGEAEAQNLLALMYLNGLGVAVDLRRAAALFEAAAGQGLKEAHYSFANLLFGGLGVARDESRAQAHLLASARAGHRAALRALGYLYHLMGEGGDWPQRCTRCFRQAAEAGDAHAQYALAWRLWQGQGAEPDRRAARYWMQAAANAGIWLAPRGLAAMQFAATTDSGDDSTGLTRPEAAEPLSELPPPTLPAPVLPAPSTEHAFVTEFGSFIDPGLCDHIVNISAPLLTPSEVVDPAHGTPLRSQLRTSHSTYLRPSMYDAAVAWVWRRLAALAGLPPEHAEPLEVLRYLPGQEYKPHYDFYTDARHKAQRVVTVFVYLSDVEAGGATAFPRLGVEIRPERGKAVRFFNCLPNGEPNRDTLHAGMPVISGEKWLATFWFWDKPFLWFE